MASLAVPSGEIISHFVTVKDEVSISPTLNISYDHPISQSTPCYSIYVAKVQHSWRVEQCCGWFECSSFVPPNTWQKFLLDKVPEITTYHCKDKESHENWQAMGLSLFLLPFLSVPVSSFSSCFQGWMLPEGLRQPSFLLTHLHHCTDACWSW